MNTASEKPTDPHAPPDRLGVRYVATLAAQGFRLLTAFASAMIVPRTLGPAVYGNYTFLLSTAATLRAFVDTGTQQAFFTFSSQERASGSLTRLYAWALALQFAVVMLFVAAAIWLGQTDWLWHGQRADQIVLVTVLDWAVFCALSLQQLGDSKGLTVTPQIIGAGASFLILVGLLALWGAGNLDFYSFVWLNLAGALCNCAMLGWWLLGRNAGLLWDGALATARYLARWWSFARPLILLQIYLPLVAYLGVWLVQRWNGPVEQGYYALALQWSSLALVFTNAGVSIFWREIAHRSAGRDVSFAADTYAALSTLLFFLAIVLACGLSAGSSALVNVIAGPSFAPAIAVVAIMAFYPAAQTLGQLSVAALKATERTSHYARWSIALSVPDLLLTYFLLAPRDATVPGFELGAIGMAIRTALYGLASVHVFDWINCNSMGLSFRALFVRRVVSLVAVGSAAWLCIHAGGAWLRSAGLGELAALLTGCMAYACATLLLLLAMPHLAGLTRAQLLRHIPGVRT
jgi:O-antigen/teichoic acid export membrane protein